MIPHGHRPRRHTGAVGFTLVELLVVLAVIAGLAALVLAALARPQVHHLNTVCRRNLIQIYKAARSYANDYMDWLPDLYNGLTVDKHPARFRNSHYCRSTDPNGKTVAAGLWLLEDYVKEPKLFYCPNTPGPRRFNGTENKLVNNIPQQVGYAYNQFPVHSAAIVPLPAGITVAGVTSCLSGDRSWDYLALMADYFSNSLQQPHASVRGMNCCLWDGSVKWLSLDKAQIPWDATEGEAKVFSDTPAGYAKLRDAWVMLSKLAR